MADVEADQFEIFLLIGLPGSGKSSFARELSKSHHVKHFEYDRLTKSFTKTARAKVAAGIMLDIEYYMNGNTVPTVKYFVIDDNFYYKSMRAPYVSFARFNKLPLRELYFDTPIDVCLKRNSDRPDSEWIPEHTINEMSKKLEPPVNPTRAFCQKSSDFLSKEFLSIKVTPPAPHVVEPLRDIDTSVSEREARDLVARCVVGEIMKEYPEMRKSGREVAKFKKYVLGDDDLSSGLLENDGAGFKEVLVDKFRTS